MDARTPAFSPLPGFPTASSGASARAPACPQPPGGLVVEGVRPARADAASVLLLQPVMPSAAVHHASGLGSCASCAFGGGASASLAGTCCSPRLLVSMPHPLRCRMLLRLLHVPFSAVLHCSSFFFALRPRVLRLPRLLCPRVALPFVSLRHPAVLLFVLMGVVCVRSSDVVLRAALLPLDGGCSAPR